MLIGARPAHDTGALTPEEAAAFQRAIPGLVGATTRAVSWRLQDPDHDDLRQEAWLEALVSIRRYKANPEKYSQARAHAAVAGDPLRSLVAYTKGGVTCAVANASKRMLSPVHADKAELRALQRHRRVSEDVLVGTEAAAATTEQPAVDGAWTRRLSSRIEAVVVDDADLGHGLRGLFDGETALELAARIGVTSAAAREMLRRAVAWLRGDEQISDLWALGGDMSAEGARSFFAAVEHALARAKTKEPPAMPTPTARPQGRCKLSVDVQATICEQRRAGASLAELARRHGVGVKLIRRVAGAVVVERVSQTKRRKEISEALHPQTKQGAAPGQAGGGKKAKTPETGTFAPSFVNATAAKTMRATVARIPARRCAATIKLLEEDAAWEAEQARVKAEADRARSEALKGRSNNPSGKKASGGSAGPPPASRPDTRADGTPKRRAADAGAADAGVSPSTAKRLLALKAKSPETRADGGRNGLLVPQSADPSNAEPLHPSTPPAAGKRNALTSVKRAALTDVIPLHPSCDGHHTTPADAAVLSVLRLAKAGKASPGVALAVLGEIEGIAGMIGTPVVATRNPARLAVPRGHVHRRGAAGPAGERS